MAKAVKKAPLVDFNDNVRRLALGNRRFPVLTWRQRSWTRVCNGTWSPLVNWKRCLHVSSESFLPSFAIFLMEHSISVVTVILYLFLCCRLALGNRRFQVQMWGQWNSTRSVLFNVWIGNTALQVFFETSLPSFAICRWCMAFVWSLSSSISSMASAYALLLPLIILGVLCTHISSHHCVI